MTSLLAAPWPMLIIGLALLALLVSVLTVLLKAEDARSPLAWTVGATAGLQSIQVARVHVFCIVTVVWLIFGVLRHQRGRWRIGWPLALLAAAALLASTALTGEMVNSPLLGIQLMILAGTAACLVAFGDDQDLRQALRGLLVVTSIACAAALLQYVHVLPYRVYLGTNRPIGIYAEPDYLGTFAAVGLLLAYRGVGRRLRAPLIFMHVVVLLLAAARAALLAVVVVAAVGYLVAKVRKEPKRAERLPGGAWTIAGSILVVVGVLVASPSLQESLESRLLGIGTISSVDVGTEARKQQLASLLELESEAPWNGLGLSASGRVGVSGHIAYLGSSDNNVGSNWLLVWWVDGGFLALPLILIFIAAVVRRISATSGLLLGIVLVSSLFSNVLFFPVSWFALAHCLVEMGREGRADPEVGSSPVPNLDERSAVR